MFTLGIFTTHIPYIALVVFYAFFWIIGVNKASAGELQSADNSISIEIYSGDNYLEIGQNDISSSSKLHDQQFLTADYNVAFAALQKFKHKCFHPDIQTQGSSYINLFSRPPPFLS